jgi:hypothetical protein
VWHMGPDGEQVFVGRSPNFWICFQLCIQFCYYTA